MDRTKVISLDPIIINQNSEICIGSTIPPLSSNWGKDCSTVKPWDLEYDVIRTSEIGIP